LHGSFGRDLDAEGELAGSCRLFLEAAEGLLGPSVSVASLGLGFLGLGLGLALSRDRIALCLLDPALCVAESGLGLLGAFLDPGFFLGGQAWSERGQDQGTGRELT
jgi:hypothetical protein